MTVAIIGGLRYITARGAHTIPGVYAAGHSRLEAVAMMVPLNLTGQAVPRPSASPFVRVSPDISPEAGGVSRGAAPSVPEGGIEPPSSCERGILSPFAGDVEPRRNTPLHSETAHRETSDQDESRATAHMVSPDISPEGSAPEWVARAMRKIQRDDKGCWLWTGAMNSKGYGQIGVRREGRKMISKSVHRLFAALYHGPIGPKQMACHTCDVRACCNPAHLYIGDVLSNRRDAVERGSARSILAERNGEKTHCPHGHEYTAANTRVSYKNDRPYRQCIACARARYVLVRDKQKVACTSRPRPQGSTLPVGYRRVLADFAGGVS